VTVFCSGVAVAMRKTLPENTRWNAWVWMALTLFCIVANSSRIVPEEGQIMGSVIFDRLVFLLLDLS
jgi:hypothetical protein